MYVYLKNTKPIRHSQNKKTHPQPRWFALCANTKFRTRTVFSTVAKDDTAKNYHLQMSNCFRLCIPIWIFCHLEFSSFMDNPTKVLSNQPSKATSSFFSKASQASFKYERVSMSVRNIVSDLFSQHLWFERREKLTKKNHWC